MHSPSLLCTDLLRWEVQRTVHLIFSRQEAASASCYLWNADADSLQGRLDVCTGQGGIDVDGTCCCCLQHLSPTRCHKQQDTA